MQVANRALVQGLSQELDMGEAEAIALALEVEAEALLMDEQLGRETAHPHAFARTCATWILKSRRVCGSGSSCFWRTSITLRYKPVQAPKFEAPPVKEISITIDIRPGFDYREALGEADR
mgnify:FL=1